MAPIQILHVGEEMKDIFSFLFLLNFGLLFFLLEEKESKKLSHPHNMALAQSTNNALLLTSVVLFALLLGVDAAPKRKYGPMSNRSPIIHLNQS